jgi:hypothetical protein
MGKSRAVALLLWAGLGLAMPGCTTLGTLKQRAEQVNVISADYAAAAILYNILRATHAEPLQFVSLTAVTGHGTATANLGLPTFILGPLANKLYSFGPNGLSGSEADDFNVSVVDDPASFAALSRPIDPATIGYLINQYYNRDAILYLSVAKMEITYPDHTTKALFNEPLISTTANRFVLSSEFMAFVYQLQLYLNEGLTALVDQSYVPQPNRTGNALFCFDPESEASDQIGIQADNPLQGLYGTPFTNTCIGKQDALNTSTAQNTITPSANTRAATGQSGGGGGNGNAKPNWSFEDPFHNQVHIYTRSVYGIYRYLGQLVRVSEKGGWVGFDDAPEGVFNGGPLFDLIMLNHDYQGCWVSNEYEGKNWCVPQNTNESKRTFQLLHELFELYAAPSNQTVTPTVRTTP